ncbi:RecQ family ATP-dependent DNA helicase [Alkalihalobacillus pseudalcaliphilus]|uniref:RecQ family ATP-dependent DNA helicase n=1 Tax=Alkalihalobacillus pseudalcaliphilus TaxID=79884 RepID=UPI00064DF036|nr:ATP-dependent DNA helicase RecQ [Alkalihalobacillus pseudalcaliphilus]KMK76478.1 ATP-dependent DNA helicase [Alkalihalobacillus pseudalcaliphilus]
MNLKAELKHHFGLDSFRPGQKEIIQAIMEQQNVVAMLPTGSGKSLCYQLPAFMSHGVTIVVSPLLSLMEDQIQQLKKNGKKEVVALNSFLSYQEKKYHLDRLHTYKMIYLAPEMLQNDQVKERLYSLTISLLVIDEAHCISQWGHDFRPDYVRLREIRQELGFPPTLAITATATAEVREDIIRILDIKEATMFIHSVERENIALRIEKFETAEDKLDRLFTLVKNLEGPGMIYFSSRLWSEKVSMLLKRQGKRVSHYHGGMKNEERLMIQQQFVQGQLEVICCTSAFGMGLNKHDVRFVIHFHYPTDLESYLQEIGRAGRDQKPSIAYLLTCPYDHGLALQLISMDKLEREQLQAILSRFLQINHVTPEQWYDLCLQYGSGETAARVLYFQLEKWGFIEGELVNAKGMTEFTLVERLLSFFNERLHIKEEKLKEMEQWIYVNRCRREGILTVFDELKTEQLSICCDICGFDQTTFFQDYHQPIQMEKGWQHQLAIKLGQVGNKT